MNGLRIYDRPHWPQWYECNPGAKLWRPPVKVLRLRSDFDTCFCKTKKDFIDQEAGEKYETKVFENDSSYCLASY